MCQCYANSIKCRDLCNCKLCENQHDSKDDASDAEAYVTDQSDNDNDVVKAEEDETGNESDSENFLDDSDY